MKNDSKLTILDKIELLGLRASSRRNFYFKTQFNSLPILIPKGYIPIMIRDINTNLIISNERANPIYPDYFCLNNTGQLINLTEINFKASNLNYKNVEIKFTFDYENQTILSNYTINHVYNLLGTFTFYIYTSFGQNLLTQTRMFINVQKIEKYPFKDIQINQFELDCSLIELSLDCLLRLNISNYANSFQQIFIDYGDEINFDSFTINPYCNKNLFILIFIDFKL